MRNARGSFLVMTAWLLAMLSLLAIGVSHRGQTEVRLVSYEVETAQSQLAAFAGIQRALELLRLDATPAYDSLREAWATNPAAYQDQRVMEGRTLFNVEVQDEQSRLNLNAATTTKDMIAKLSSMDSDVAQAIVAFRDAAEHPEEDAYYQTLTPPYTTQRAPFQSLAEVGLVRGMTPERFAVVEHFCTVYPTDGAPVNVNTAPREVLLALGLSDTLASGLIAYRNGNDAQPGTEDDQIFQQPSFDPDQWPWMSADDAAALNALLADGRLGVRTATVRIRAEGRLADGSTVVVANAVMTRPGEQGEPGRTLAWQWE